MRKRTYLILSGVVLIVLHGQRAALCAQEAVAEAAGSLPMDPPKIKVLPDPIEPHLKAQIQEVQDSLLKLYERMLDLRRTLEAEQDIHTRNKHREHWEKLRRTREELEWTQEELLQEAKKDEWTAVDEALERMDSWERQQEQEELREELRRERE